MNISVILHTKTAITFECIKIFLCSFYCQKHLLITCCGFGPHIETFQCGIQIDYAALPHFHGPGLSLHKCRTPALGGTIRQQIGIIAFLISQHVSNNAYLFLGYYQKLSAPDVCIDTGGNFHIYRRLLMGRLIYFRSLCMIFLI